MPSGLNDAAALTEPADGSTVALQVTNLDAHRIVGTWRNVLLNVYRRDTEAHHVDGLRPVIAKLQAEHPAGIGMVTLVEENASMPSAGARERLPKLFKEVAPGVLCSCLIFEGTGFKAAAVRAITTTFNTVASQPFPHRVFATVSDASAWMAPKLWSTTRDGTAQQLAEACEDLRHQMRVSTFPSA